MMPLGNAEAHTAFASAMSSGSLHHAWLFTGPEGVGKASFARIAAQRLLAEAASPGALPPGFDVPDTDRTAHLIAAGSHPDYRELARLPKDPDKPEGELARSISIAQVRSLLPMFATKPALSPRRVILIDAADDLERPGASNALLKNLEEPPQGTIFILISHAPGRLLPTIRSRCRRLRFAPLSEAEMDAALRQALPDASDADRAALISAADGAPGRALRFAALGMADLDAAMTSLAERGDADNRVRARLAHDLGTKAAQPRYEAFLERAPGFIAGLATRRRDAALRQAIDCYDQARALAGSARALSLDAQATVYEMATILTRLAEHR